MSDILVTTPKSKMKEAEREAEYVKKNGGGYYFRVFKKEPSKGLDVGDKVFYVEDGYIRGYCKVYDVEHSEQPKRCEVTGNIWYGGFKVLMDATTWTWIDPIPYKGFQGWRYFTDHDKVHEIGDWLDPKPDI